MRNFRRGVAVALASSSMLAIASSAALAQDSQDSEDDVEIEELVVTGTYLQGRSQFDSASPLAVVGAEQLNNIGAANFADLVQTLTINNGAQNNPDAFTQNGTTGTSNFNLRGLGVSSTLVLLNGRRQVLTGALTNDGVNFVDTSSLIPQIATKRIEIVKDGAAALYGTDAVAGVVNFITDDDFEGISARARYSTLTNQGSQDDFLAEAKVGFKMDKLSFMGAFSYYDRTALTTLERRLSRPVDDTSSLGNPGAFFLFGALPVIDPTGCSQFGGFERPLGGGAQGTVDALGLPFTAGFCGFDFGDYFNLVPEEQRTQAYATASYEFSENHVFRAEWAWADTQAIRGNSPTFPFLQLGQAVIPANHPNNIFPEALGPILFFGRAIGNGGDVSPSVNDSHTERFSVSVSGPISDTWDYDVAFTYAENTFINDTEDTVTSRFAAALRGQGGPNCNGGAPGQGGCEYYNPFATSFTTAPNSRAVLDWIIDSQVITTESELSTIDAVVSGSVMELPAGEVGLALGFQLRNESFDRDLNQLANDDAFAFVIGAPDFAAERDPYAFFAETIIPLAEGLELQAAARFEDYGGTIGETIDPKVALLWQATNDLVVRASYSTSFRAPSVFQQFGVGTSLNQVTDPVSGGQFFAAVRNPTPGADGRAITPEQSEAMNLGMSYSNDSGLSIDVDFWRYDFSDVIIQENFQAVINADPNDTTRVVRAAGPGSPILFVFVDYVNASSVETTGFDVNVSWDIDTEMGTFTPFIEGTWVSSYKLADPQAGNVDGVGSRNFTNFGSPTPELRFNTGFSLAGENRAFRVFGRYIGGLDDDQNGGIPIGSMFTLDAMYKMNLGWVNEDLQDTTLQLGVINAFDQAPPQVFTNGGFESRTHDPRGRVVYLEVSTRF